jgi:hypothetical protein
MLLTTACNAKFESFKNNARKLLRHVHVRRKFCFSYKHYCVLKNITLLISFGQQKEVVLYVQVTVNRDKFRKNNQLDASISKIYFCHKALHVSGIFYAHHQGLSTVHTAMNTLHAGYGTAS